MLNKPLTENRMALFNILSTVIIAGVNFFTIPIFTRMLDTGGYGIVNVYTAWVSIFVVFIGLKADGSIGSAKANLADDEQDSYHFSILALATLAFLIVFSLVLLLLDPLSSLLSLEPMLVVCMVVQSFGTFVINLFSMRFIFRKQAQLNFAISVGVCLVTTIMSVALIFLVFTGDDAYMGRALGLCVPNVVVGVALGLGLAFRQRWRIKLKYWRFCLVLTLPLIFHGLSQLVLGQTGKIAIQQISGDSLAGIYSIAVVIVGLLSSIYSALNNAFVPFMYDDLSGKTDERVKQSHFRNYFTSFTLGTVAFVLIAPEILKLMSTEAYWGAIPLLPLLTVGQYCVFLYSFPVNFEFYSMKTRSIAIGTVLAAILNIALTVALVPAFGMMGAAFSTMVAYLALFVFHFCIARFLLGDRNYLARYYAGGLAFVLAASFACYPLNDLAVARWAFAIVALFLVALRVYKTRSIF